MPKGTLRVLCASSCLLYSVIHPASVSLQPLLAFSLYAHSGISPYHIDFENVMILYQIYDGSDLYQAFQRDIYTHKYTLAHIQPPTPHDYEPHTKALGNNKTSR